MRGWSISQKGEGWQSFGIGMGKRFWGEEALTVERD